MHPILENLYADRSRGMHVPRSQHNAVVAHARADRHCRTLCSRCGRHARRDLGGVSIRRIGWPSDWRGDHRCHLDHCRHAAHQAPAFLPGRYSGVAPAPRAWIVGIFAAVAASILVVAPWIPNAIGSTLTFLVIEAAAVITVTRWSRRPGWGDRQILALAAGPLFAYAWHALSRLRRSTPPRSSLCGSAMWCLQPWRWQLCRSPRAASLTSRSKGVHSGWLSDGPAIRYGVSKPSYMRWAIMPWAACFRL